MVVSDSLILEAQRTSAASVHEASGRKGAFPETIRPIDREMAFCGRAFTVRCPSGDNLWIHQALAELSEGDVLVVDAGPQGAHYGYWGEIMATAAVTAGAAALVISGGVRDMLGLIRIGLPTFSASITTRGTVKNPQGNGIIRESIRIGEVVINPGDFIMGDADGVVVLTPEQAFEAIPKAIERDNKEVAILERIRAGELTLNVYNL